MFYNPRARLSNRFKLLRNSNSLGFGSMENFNQLYTLTGKVLGSGGQGEVLEAIIISPKAATQTHVAVKTYSKKTSPVALQMALQEPLYLLKLKHVNIVQAYGLYEDEKNVYFVMEKLDGRNLLQTLTSIEAITVDQARTVIYSLILALSDCEVRGISHRDLKLENILLRPRRLREEIGIQVDPPGPDLFNVTTSNRYLNYCRTLEVNDEEFDIVLGDFGLAYQVEPAKRGQPNEIYGKVGTTGYMAPEILLEGLYDYKVDVYALGVIFFMLLSGGYNPFTIYSQDEKFPYTPDIIPSTANTILGLVEFKPEEAWTTIPSDAKDLVKLLLSKDPASRPTYTQIMAHKFFKPETNCTQTIDLFHLKRVAAAAKNPR